MNMDLFKPAQQEELASWLAARGVKVRGFSHVGIVVENLRQTLDALALTDASWAEAEPVWGEAFGCYIARNVVDDAEIEVIEPEKPSFLRTFLEGSGEGTHHLSFWVDNLEAALRRLKDSGTEMAYPEICDGLHGRIAFVNADCAGVQCVELCEAHDEA
jgi:hypothetical protein